MSKPVLGAIAFIALVIVAVVYLTFGLPQYTCEVCMEYKGRENCATASGTTEEEALRSATDTACAPITAGMTESIQCSRTKPARITWQ